MDLSNIKFYYSFFIEYIRQSIRESLINFLGLSTEYYEDKLYINYFHRGEIYRIVLPKEKKLCPFKRVETHIVKHDGYVNVAHAHESTESFGNHTSRVACESCDDEISLINEEIKVVDVTKNIKKVIGPHYDFHKIPTNPGMLGYDNLVFYKKNGDRVKYSRLSVITI